MTKVSAPTSAVAAGSLTTTPVPKIGGTVRVGSTLTATPGTWAPAPINLAYAWLRDGVVIPSALSATYQLVAADLGTHITVTVTGSKAGYTSVSKTSTPTAAVAP